MGMVVLEDVEWGSVLIACEVTEGDREAGGGWGGVVEGRISSMTNAKQMFCGFAVLFRRW